MEEKMTFRSLSRGRFHFLAALYLATNGLIAGCNPQTLNFLLMPFVDDKEQPKCKLASADKKEVTVAIVASFANLETRPEMLPIETELSERLANEMRRLAKDNKEKLSIVPASKVRGLVNQDAGGTMSRQEIGERLKADYLISLEINSISLYEKGSFNQLFRGKTEIAVTCIDVHKPRNEGTICQEVYSREYPGARGPVDAGNSSVLEFRTQFLNVLAQELAHYFVAYPGDFVRRMD
jgi:hypothetical protein